MPGLGTDLARFWVAMGVVAVGCVVALGGGMAVGCEPLRPVASEGTAESESAALKAALALQLTTAPLPERLRALRVIVDQSQDEDRVERARRDQARAYVEWFQLAHIALELLPARGGASLMEGLRLEITASGGAPAFKATRRTLPPELEWLRPLMMDSQRSATTSAVKAALNAKLLGLEHSADPDTRAQVALARRFLVLEASWRYDRTWHGSTARVEEWLRFIRRSDVGELKDNAWLALRLSLALALAQPRVPRRALLETVGTLVDVSPSQRAAKPYAILLGMGQDKGETLPERIWLAWRYVVGRVGEVLEGLEAAPRGSDGRRIWNRLAPWQKLRLSQEPPTSEQLYALGEPLRTETVRHWLGGLRAQSPTGPRALAQLETTARALRARAPERGPVVTVMTMLVVEEAVVMALGDRVRGRMVRLVDRGSFLDRSLVLPGGIVSGEFGKRVAACIGTGTKKPAGCLWRIVAQLVKQARRKRSR